MTTRKQRAAEIRQKVDVVGSCWLYPTTRRAYLTVDGIPYLVYRIMYEEFVGPIPVGSNILHTCDDKNCCNPAHLELGTKRKNVLDAVTRSLIPSSSPLAGISWQASRGRWLVMPRVKGKKKTLYAGKDLFEACCALKRFQAVADNTPSITLP